MKYTVTVTRTEWTEVEVEADDHIQAQSDAIVKAITDADELVWETGNMEAKI